MGNDHISIRQGLILHISRTRTFAFPRKSPRKLVNISTVIVDHVTLMDPLNPVSTIGIKSLSLPCLIVQNSITRISRCADNIAIGIVVPI